MTDGSHPPRDRGGAYGDLARYSGLGLAFGATVGLFALAGHWLDGRLDTSPWFLIGGVFLGFALGVRSLIHKVPSARAEPRTRRDPPLPPSP